ncbi:MAG: response regulator transcription factor [Chloroflexi bacterium]|nr:response regulator transcription factor [Chloroflexota bacterium]
MNQKLQVLVVESDAAQRAGIARTVEDGGYEALLCEDGIVGLRQFFSSHPDVLVISLEAAELPGWELVERVRSVANTPIIVCANESNMESLQKGIDLQVDGFLVKPFTGDELAVRLRAISERNAEHGNGQSWLYQRNGLKINWRSCEVTVNGQSVELTGTEYRLLKYLVEHQGWVLSHDQILTEVWGPEYQGEKDRVKLYVWYLRRKIESDPCKPGLIVTKRGLGYSFVG